MIRPGLAVLAAAGVIFGTLAGAAAAGSPARAATVPYQAVDNGVAGYYDTGLPVHDIGATVTTQGPALTLGGMGTGGIAEQLCDPETGWGLQLGFTVNGIGTSLAIRYKDGILPGAAAARCTGNTVLAGSRVLNSHLAGVLDGDTVRVYLSYSLYKTRGKWYGAAVFSAIDLSDSTGTRPRLYAATVRGLPADRNLTAAGVSIQQRLTGPYVLACYTGPPLPPPPSYDGIPSGACDDTADFSSVYVNGHQGLAARGNSIQVITTQNGASPSHIAIVAPNYTLAPTSGPGESSFSILAGDIA